LSLYDKYKDKANFISFYDTDVKESKREDIKKLGYGTSENLPWLKFYSSQDIINKIWIKKLYPQTHVYIGGIHKKAFVGSSERNKNDLILFVDRHLN
jgi:hypothetical protein